MAFNEKRVEELVERLGDEIVLYQDDYEKFPQFAFGKPTVPQWAEYVNALGKESRDEDSITQTLLNKTLLSGEGLGDMEALAKMTGSYAQAGDVIAVELRLLAAGGEASIGDDCVTYENTKHGLFRFRKPTPIVWQRMRTSLSDARKSRYQALLQFCKDSLASSSPEEVARLEACKEDFPAFPIEVGNKIQSLSAGGSAFRPGKR